MRAKLQQKLRSDRGASLLLALLLLLLCAMVAASILMAAASNAGKHRSNLEEHQTYLALSSAVSLLCDELNAAEYRGQYKYWTTTDTVDHGDGTSGTVTLYHFEQLDGAYPCELSPLLLTNLDAIFSREITERLSGAGFSTLSTKSQTVSWTHDLTVTPQTGTALDTRTIRVHLNVIPESYAIELTAALDDYQIQAELTPTESKYLLPSSLVDRGADAIQQTEPIKWRIGWITPVEEEEP